jgi:hypothetical protein
VRAVPAVVAVLVAAGSVALVRRRRSGAERVSLSYDDGSTLTLDAGTPEADRLLAAARDALSPAR